MAKYYLHITDGKEADVEIQAANNHEAMNDALNALSKFACRSFPPPDNLTIKVSDAANEPIATLSFGFEIRYAPGVMA